MSGALTSIPVGTGADAYEVVVGHGVVDAVLPALGEGVQRVLVVHPPTLAVWAQRLADTIREGGPDAYLAVVPDAEEAKSAVVAAELWSALGQAGFTRTDAVVGVGGGTVTDLAGFVAATWLRGVRVVQVPTTLLGMVDAAVGGKTGINTAEGKNLVGSFHPPAGVLCDLDTLSTLPKPELVAGLAEVVKCGFIADPRILELVEADPVAAVDVEGPFLRQLVEWSIRVKAEVVTADLREAELREVLNYGHTFGHAVEQVEGYRWRHGEAVSVGMTYAAELGRLSGHLASSLVDRHRSVLTSLGLPVAYAPSRWEELLAAMRRDKKTRGSRLRFVVLDDVAQPVRLEDPPEAMLREAYSCVTR
ncbi:MAG: 3-dehydroquinate synthase [Lapillicoccus sp.]